MRAFLLATLAALTVACPAVAVTLTAPDGSPAGPPWQEWANASRAPAVPGDITFHAGPPPAGPCALPATGCAVWWPDGHADIYVTVGTGDEHHIEMHELGHVFDARVMTDSARSAWKVATMDWRAGWANGGDEPSVERFAEGYAFCALHGSRIVGAVRGVYGYVAGPVRQRRACRVLRLAAAGVFG